MHGLLQHTACTNVSPKHSQHIVGSNTFESRTSQVMTEVRVRRASFHYAKTKVCQWPCGCGRCGGTGRTRVAGVDGGSQWAPHRTAVTYRRFRRGYAELSRRTCVRLFHKVGYLKTSSCGIHGLLLYSNLTWPREARRVHTPAGTPPSGQLVEATHFEPCWTVPEIQTH